MKQLKVLIAIQSQLFQEMLAKVLGKIEDFAVVQVLYDQKHLPDAIYDTNPDWVLLASETRRNTPDWIETIINSCPEICIAEIALDKNQASFHGLHTGDLDIRDLTLEEFITILESGCSCQA